MARSRSAEVPRGEALPWQALWAALCAALFLIPDERLLRWKLLGLEAGTALVLAAAVIQAARSGVWLSSPLDWPVALYGLCALAFFGLSPERAVSSPELCRQLFACASCLAAGQIFGRVRRPRWSLLVLAFMAAICAALALSKASPAERSAGSFGNPVLLGVALAAATAATAVLAPEADGKFIRQTAWGCLLLELAGVWASGTRAAWLGLFAAALAWALLRMEGRRRLFALAALAAAGAGLGALFCRRAWTHGLIWDGAWRLWLAHPWLGCGLGRFYAEFPAFASARLRALWPQGRAIVNYAHNEYLQTLAETGLAGLAALLYVPASLAGQLSRRRPDGPALACALAAIVVFAAALFSPDMRFGTTAFLAFACAGAASALMESKPLSLPAGAGPTFAGVGLAAVAAWAALAAQPYLAERRLEAAPAFEIQATPQVKEQARQLEEALAKDPADAELAEKLGYLYAQAQAWQPALERFQQAARLTPDRPGNDNNIGNVYYQVGQPDKAVEYWQKSLAIKPDQADAHLNLAKLYFEQGRVHEASAQAQAAVRVDPGNEKARILLEKMVQ